MDWIKIMCNLLDHRKIKMIRKGPEGNTMVLLWLLMLTEAGKCKRGGYLMVSDTIPYSAATLSMVTDIPLPIVQLGLAVFNDMDMIDQQDGAIFITNWRKYQSEDKLEARREKERIRQQRHRQNERDKIRALPSPSPDQVSRDSHVTMSRDVTLENRGEKNRKEKTTTDEIRPLLSGTPLSKVSDVELQGLAKRHGIERLANAADVAAETWRRSPEERHNPGGYLQSLCSSLVVPDWYVPFGERKALTESLHRRKVEVKTEEAAQKVQEEAQIVARNELWTSLSEEQHEKYRTAALAQMPKDMAPPVAVMAMAKLLAWKSADCTTIESDDQSIQSPHPVVTWG
ncbi:MAG: phage replisome organizer N-terminal domain-containing protein [Desulfuromonadales bacterium]|nr:phage replisome organizer N-terminal domain-containing protein [Desulfuromonadales bacterium]